MPAPKELVPRVLAEGLYFGESPRYRDGKLYISDMTGRKIYAIDEHTGKKEVFLNMENQPNGMCFLDDGSLICSSMFDAKLYHVKDGKSTLYADMSHVMTGYCGDMVIDKAGRVFLDDSGARVLHGEKPGPGRLLRIDPDRSVNIAEEKIFFPNALCISPDGKSLYNAESFGYGLLKFDLAEDGTLSNRQEVWTPATLAGERGASAESMIGIDGGCMDAEGGIWLSLLALEQFVRLDPDSGEITHRIKVSGHAVCCTLGGDDGKTLFLGVNWTPPDENLFKAMVALKTRGTVLSVRVDIAHGAARP
ncbi:Six-bladed beta-propeller, TolB-like protein [Cordyceps fumosorosea ARSEF 2679]|uniref:Six-bladed beta-propeller, TolB-like protein n=1 Tax=Cordyceps fumosorosea (strain ARSEF 2679) TaxID=1081104 RepID=A0A167LEP9_CORFA|nr:Six-bladed beta-propeller, TolB-like protein [Cordyceps fumosorosea ARSEF 2679]OAA53001.1 Six-bladed beta-propeller, TolB-like protein [Cordyceps fumosorosea ARSEF 2679]